MQEERTIELLSPFVFGSCFSPKALTSWPYLRLCHFLSVLPTAFFYGLFFSFFISYSHFEKRKRP